MAYAKTAITSPEIITWDDLLPTLERLKNTIEDIGLLNLPGKIVEDSPDIFSNITEEEWIRMKPCFKDIKAMTNKYLEFDKTAPNEVFRLHNGSLVMKELNTLIFDLKYKMIITDKEARAIAVERVYKIKEMHEWLNNSIAEVKERGLA